MKKYFDMTIELGKRVLDYFKDNATAPELYSYRTREGVNGLGETIWISEIFIDKLGWVYTKITSNGVYDISLSVNKATKYKSLTEAVLAANTLSHLLKDTDAKNNITWKD